MSGILILILVRIVPWLQGAMILSASDCYADVEDIFRSSATDLELQPEQHHTGWALKQPRTAFFRLNSQKIKQLGSSEVT